MAERRMFAKSIVESDAFLDMPAEAQMLYIHLNMAADDDGFCDSPRRVMRSCGASNDSMKLLIAKKYVLTFEKGDGFVVVVKHWRMNNYIRKDTYNETKYKEFMRALYYDENKSYSMNPGDGHEPCFPSPAPEPITLQPPARDEPVTDPSRTGDESLTQQASTDSQRDVDESLTQVRLGKDSKGKYRSGEVRKGELLEGETKSTDGRTDPQLRLKRVDFFCGRIKMSEDVGYKMFNRDYWIEAAEREGIPRKEIEERMAQIEKEEQK